MLVSLIVYHFLGCDCDERGRLNEACGRLTGICVCKSEAFEGDQCENCQSGKYGEQCDQGK